MAEIDAVVIQQLINKQMYPEVRLHARNQILADLMTFIAVEGGMEWSRDGQTTLFDMWFRLRPDQMAALEDSVLDHKAKED